MHRTKGFIAALLLACAFAGAAHAAGVKEIGVTYVKSPLNVPAIVEMKLGLFEKEFGPDGITVTPGAICPPSNDEIHSFCQSRSSTDSHEGSYGESTSRTASRRDSSASAESGDPPAAMLRSTLSAPAAKSASVTFFSARRGTCADTRTII